MIKRLIKKLLPTTILRAVRPYYHGVLALKAHYLFGRPSNKLIVIGVTGTNGKTTTVNLITKILESAGHKVGSFSTINYNFSGATVPNTIKMTMPSGWVLHRGLAQMVKNGCTYAVLEVSSEGLAQNRHWGINFDVAVFTNLTPEHLQSHGGFANYKKAKGKLFAVLSKHPLTKQKLNILPTLQKTIVANADDQHSSYYLDHPGTNRIRYGVKQAACVVTGTNITYNQNGVSFTALKTNFNLQLKGQFDVYNALAALATAEALGISASTAKDALEKISVVPGRVEVLQTTPYAVVIDYAYEPEEMRQLYQTIARWPHQRIIQVLGPTGGGRDNDRIKILGAMAGQTAALVFITTDDPYDDDPAELAKPMIEGAVESGKKLGQDVFLTLDRRTAIAAALRAAKAGDIVLITGKGADQKMCLANGKTIDWDDRVVAREEMGRN